MAAVGATELGAGDHRASTVAASWPRVLHEGQAPRGGGPMRARFGSTSPLGGRPAKFSRVPRVSACPWGRGCVRVAAEGEGTRTMRASRRRGEATEHRFFASIGGGRVGAWGRRVALGVGSMRLEVWLLVLGLTGCTRTCDRRDLLTRVESPIEVTVFEERTTGPNLFAPRGRPVVSTDVRHWLGLGGERPLRLPVYCARWGAEVSVSPEADRVAFRCASNAAWDLSFRVADDREDWPRALAPGNPWLRPDGWPDWKSVPGLVEVAPRLLLESNPRAERVLAEVRRRAGSEALAGVLARVVTMRIRTEWDTAPDPWVEAFGGLAPGERGGPLGALRGALATAGSGEGPVARVLEVYEPNDATIADDLAARLMEVEEAARRAKSGEVVARKVHQAALQRLATLRPEKAGAIACARLSRSRHDSAAIAVVKQSGVRCPALATDR